MPTRKQKVSLSTRLSRYGLEEMESELKDLHVNKGEVILDPSDKHHAKRTRRLKVHSVDDLKQWMGVPRGAIRHTDSAPSHENDSLSTNNCLFQPFPTLPEFDAELSAHLVAYMLHPTPKYLSAGDRQIVSRINERIRESGIAISIFLALDIHIEENTTLIVGPNVQILFANSIVMENNSALRMESFGSHIDCARLQYVES